MDQARIGRRLVLVGSVGAMALGASGCWGSFSLTNKLWKFNDDVSSSKWVKWLVFLGLVIIPAYALVILGDALIFNTIEFFSGSNPIKSATRDLGNGNLVSFRRIDGDTNLIRLEHRREQNLVGIWFVRKSGDVFTLYDGAMKRVAETRSVDIGVDVIGSDGSVVIRMTSDELKDAEMKVDQHGSPMLALEVERKAIRSVARSVRSGAGVTL